MTLTVQKSARMTEAAGLKKTAASVCIYVTDHCRWFQDRALTSQHAAGVFIKIPRFLSHNKI
jgi:hypothetical protein